MVYGHLQQINFEQASLYVALNLRTLAANAVSGFAANGTCRIKIVTCNFTSCSRPLAATTFSNFNLLQLLYNLQHENHLQLNYLQCDRPFAARRQNFEPISFCVIQQFLTRLSRSICVFFPINNEKKQI